MSEILTQAQEWDRPDHYGGEENPFEPIKIIDHYGLGFNLGNAVKYILRMGRKKGEPSLKDLKKAYTYIGFEIRRRERTEEQPKIALRLGDTLRFTPPTIDPDKATEALRRGQHPYWEFGAEDWNYGT